MAQKYFKANIEKLESLRIARGWSREALADKALVSTRTLDSLMAGENGVLSTFAKIAKALDTPVNSLLDGYETPAAQPRGLESPPDQSEALSTQRIKGVKISFGDNSPYTLDTSHDLISKIVAHCIASTHEVVVIEITKGSIIVELELSEDDLLRLVAAFTETRLDSIHVEAIRLPATTGPLAAGLLEIIQPPGTAPGEMTNPVTPELTLTRTPAKSLAFSVNEARSNQTDAVADRVVGFIRRHYLLCLISLLLLLVSAVMMPIIAMVERKKRRDLEGKNQRDK
jgi:transcriptional regulator with XRE-family HTH domain